MEIFGSLLLRTGGGQNSRRSLLNISPWQTFRETSCRLIAIAVCDVLLLPFVLVALMCPSRTDIVLRAVLGKLLEKFSIEHLDFHEVELACDFSFRVALFWLSVTAPIDFAGIISGSICFMLPYPTAISLNVRSAYKAALTDVLQGERRLDVYVSQRSRMNTQLSIVSACLLFLTAVEVCSFSFLSHLLLPPWTETLWRKPVENVFSARVRGAICCGNANRRDSNGENSDDIKGKPILLITVSSIQFLLDWLTF